MLLMDLIKRLNWVDVLVAMVFFRIVYSATQRGIFIELFKLFGAVSGCYVPLHYFTKVSDFFKKFVPPPPTIPVEIWDFIIFFALILVGYFIFVFLRESISMWVKTQVVSKLNKWGAAVLGVARGFIVVSLIIFILTIPYITYFVKSAQESFSGRYLIGVSVNTYSFIWNKIMSKFIPKEKFNDVVLEIQDGVLQE